MNLDTIQKGFEANRDRYIEEWKAFLRFPTIGTQSEHDADCAACAQWLVDHLRGMGLESRIVETTGQPLVFAERAGLDGTPTILFYGHYDVQPVDPIDDWEIPPFEPELRDGRMYARGAQDNKGQVMFALKAIELLIAAGELDCTIKVLLEGQEESGSGGIADALPGLGDSVAADVLMVCDTEAVASGAPTVTMGLRGMVYLTVELTGPSRDLHSGVHGGSAPNPAAELARLAASLHDNDGSIAVDGFYNDVNRPSERLCALAEAAGFDAAAYEADTGVPPVAGEKLFSPVVRVGFRPSIDVNGIHSGYGGSGTKTIIPSSATLKLSARLVPGQDPAECLSAIIAHLESHAPAGLTLVVTDSGVGGSALSLDPESALVEQVIAILATTSDQEPVLHWNGASIPITSLLAEASGAEPLLVGFGSDADKIHAVGESFALGAFQRGYTYVAMFLSEYGRMMHNGHAG